jgi:hypothetical protein
MTSYRKAQTSPGAAASFLDTGGKSTVINDGVPD